MRIGNFDSSKVNPRHFLRWLGIPAQQNPIDSSSVVRSLALWSWQDVQRKYQRVGNLREASNPTWSDLAEKLCGTVSFFKDKSRGDWFYREDQDQSSNISGRLASVSPVAGAPTLEQFLRRCGLMNEDVANAFRAYEAEKLPPAEILEKLITEPLPNARWNREREKYEAVRVQNVEVLKRIPECMAETAHKKRGLTQENIPSWLKPVRVELDNGETKNMWGWEVAPKAWELEPAEESLREAQTRLQSDGGSNARIIRPEKPSGKLVVCHGLWGAVASQQIYGDRATLASVTSPADAQRLIQRISRGELSSTARVRLALDNIYDDRKTARMLAVELVDRKIVAPDKLSAHQYDKNDLRLIDAIRKGSKTVSMNRDD